jgi:CheY-like chemotaxis protein
MAHVLVVDDDEHIREFVALALSCEGHDVTTASNGAVALDHLQSSEPDVILLDMSMPIMDGWKFARVYRTLPRNGAALVVMTAARDAAACAREISADAHIDKPFDLDTLLNLVEGLANGRPLPHP